MVCFLAELVLMVWCGLMEYYRASYRAAELEGGDGRREDGLGDGSVKDGGH